MKRVFGLVGYACNGKSTIIKKIVDENEFKFIDLPQIYKNEAYKAGYEGVTPWYEGVGLKQYCIDSRKAIFEFIDKNLCTDQDLIIDDIFDIEVYNKLIEIFPQMELISFHSKYNDRLNRLSKRAKITDREDLIRGLGARDNMKRYCGIEEVLTHCRWQINNKKDIDSAKKLLDNKINRNLIICVVGYSGCGKSTICKHLSEKFDIPLFKYGIEVSRFIKGTGYNKSREFVSCEGIEKYDELIKTNMRNSLQKYMMKNKFFIIDGIVSDDIYDWLKENNVIHTVYIKLNQNERLKRLTERENISLEMAKEELHIKDSIKIECGLDLIVSKSNKIVDANKSLDAVLEEVTKLVEKFNQR